MSKKPTPEEQPLLSRRKFGVTSITAGLGLLLGANELAAQQKKGGRKQKSMAEQLREAGPHNGPPESRRIVDAGPLMPPPEFADLSLALGLEIMETGIALDLYAINKTEHSYNLSHTTNGAIRHVPRLTMTVGKKEYELAAYAEGYRRASMSRAMRPGHATIAAAKNGQAARFYLGHFTAQWTPEILKAAKKLGGKKAELEIALSLHVTNAAKTRLKPLPGQLIKLPAKLSAPEEA